MEEKKIKRMSVIPNVLRNLSGVDDNEKLLMGRHTSLSHSCGEVLTSSKDVGNNLELENVMVCFLANIGLHTDLSTQSNKVVWDILTSWST